MMKEDFWKNVKLIIFDVDGTLYNQKALRKVMLRKLLRYYLLRPWKYNELLIIRSFRREREKRAGFIGEDLSNEQYIWCSNQLDVDLDLVKKVINKWIFTLPNRYLKSCMYPGVRELFDNLRHAGIQTAIYSDYDSRDKLKEMQLETDLQVCSTDSDVNAFKPEPKGIQLILNKLNIRKNDCLFIGDRIELDGICATNAGVEFLLVDKKGNARDFFHKLSSKITSFVK